jgi:hypothetical protein
MKIPKKITTYFLVFFKNKMSIPRAKMVKRSDKTNTGEGDKDKKSRTVSDDSGGKSFRMILSVDVACAFAFSLNSSVSAYKKKN